MSSINRFTEPSNLSLAIHATGLIVFYSGYGLLQERIMKGEYGPERAHFGSSSLLVLLNRLFAMGVGMAILGFKSRQADAPPFKTRLVPKSPLFAYAAVAACNFLSTSCQYEALKHVSFTTQSLAKCAKMWVSAGVVTLGCAVYLFSNPPTSKHGVAASTTDADWWSGLMGTILLMGYLFFDGLTSTTQERVFGKSPSSSDPFGPQSPVLDQMIYVNFFAVLISVGVSVFFSMSGSLGPSVWLLFNSPALCIDVLLLSATAALGLIVLLNTIACFGALTSSTIMTCRQFLSILINAGAFGNFASIGAQGWLGVGYVGSGVFIKMDPRFREQKKPVQQVNQEILQTELNEKNSGTTMYDADEEASMHLLPRAATGQVPGTPMTPYPVSPRVSAEGSFDASSVAPGEKGRRMRLFKQYGMPLVVPTVFAIVLTPFTGSVPAKLPSSLSGYIPYLSSGATSSSAVVASDAASDAFADVIPSSSGTTMPVTKGDKVPMIEPEQFEEKPGEFMSDNLMEEEEGGSKERERRTEAMAKMVRRARAHGVRRGTDGVI